MPLISPKGSLPHGWVVHRSRKYPDRAYYFNTNTGTSVWELPELDPPRILSEDEAKTDMNNKSLPVSNKLEVEEPPQNSEKDSKPIPPPTAVVVPVVHKQKENPVSHTQRKRKLENSNEESSKELKISKLKKGNISKSKKGKISKLKGGEDSKLKKGSVKKKKKISPLNKSDLEEGERGKVKKKKISPLNKSDSEEGERVSHVKIDKSPSSEKLKEQVVIDESLGSSSSSNGISNTQDVEMHDVSMDLLDGLAEKKENVFNTFDCYYIVVDTNVLIRELHLIHELKDTPLDGCGPPHIFIPWVVVQELDKLKNIKSPKGTHTLASAAIRYLNTALAKHPRFHGQSLQEAEEWAKLYSNCNDDKIIECCMALKDKMPAEKVIMLTNDKNLVNKALICKVNVHNFDSMMKKVTPDIVFNYEELKMNKNKKASTELQSPLVSSEELQEKILQTKRDIYKREIGTIMSNARTLLKVVLVKFLSEEMFEAYGNLWVNFKINVKLLKGLLEAVERYWAAVFSLFFSKKDKRNFELLLEKESRPEGFFSGDKDECLVILSAIQDVFRQIQKRRPKIKVPLEQIQEYRVECLTSFTSYCETESSIRTTEEATVRTLLDNNWTAINQLCGMLLDHYEVPHNLNYEKCSQTLPAFEFRRIMTILYPAVQQFKSLLQNVYQAIIKSKPVKVHIKRLCSALTEFIPSLRIPMCITRQNWSESSARHAGEVENGSNYDSPKYPFLSTAALERFLTSPQNRGIVEVGIEQIGEFHTKLDEVLHVMLALRNKSPESETMICE